MNPFWTVSLFWIAAMVCVLIALAFILPALLRVRSGTTKAARRDVNIAVYRDQLKEIEADRANGLLSDVQFGAVRQELEARLAEDALSPDDAHEPVRADSRRLGYAMGVVLPVAAFGLYFWLGNPMSLIPIAEAQAASPHPEMAGAQSEHDFMKMIERVEQKTQANPDDGEAWAMLAKTYAATEQWPQALPAFEKAAKLMPQDASVLSGYAEALAIANGQMLAGKPMEWVRKALKADPQDSKGLELAGIHAFQQGDYAEAALYFQRLHDLLPPDSAYARDIQSAQREAEGRLAQNGGAMPKEPTALPRTADNRAADSPAASIKGRIDIAPALKSALASNDVLFVFARAGQGGPPVAVMRASASHFPLDFELNDSMAMNPDNPLSQQQQVILVARVSKSGSPMAQPGDFEGSVSGIKVGMSGINLLIDQTRP